MIIHFDKYQGTGNDFILIDDRVNALHPEHDQIARICSRRFGVGADGLILLRNNPSYDFEMVYYNSDGRLSTMCGNGGRCIVSFAKRLGILRDHYHFLAADGPHEAWFTATAPDMVKLRMKDVSSIEKSDEGWLLDTGSPHLVLQVDNLDSLDVKKRGYEIRNKDRFRSDGVNVNFAQSTIKGLFLRTYERGVEDETLSCGTGVTATALVALAEGWLAGEPSSVQVDCPGGLLTVHAKRTGALFTDVWLEGPAEFVFSGEYIF